MNIPEADIIAKADTTNATNTTATPKFRIDSTNSLLRVASIETSENTSLNEMIDNYITSTDPNDAVLRHALSFLRKRKVLSASDNDMSNRKSSYMRIVMHKAMTPVYCELDGNVALRVALKGKN